MSTPEEKEGMVTTMEDEPHDDGDPEENITIERKEKRSREEEKEDEDEDEGIGGDGEGQVDKDEEDSNLPATDDLPEKEAEAMNNDSSSKEEKENDEPSEQNLPARPIKRARTAYFIFADEKRPEIQAKHQGEGVAVVARAMGQLWSALSDDDRAVYQQKAAEERERVSKEIAKYNLDSFEVNAHKPLDPNSLVLPVARIRKISKLDPDVSGVSKEAAMLVTKCAELATVKLGIESVKVAQLQNRRKLLPEDVAQVCSTREQFLFLREDVRDLVRDQKDANEGNKSASGNASTAAAAASSRPLTAYFGPK